MSDASRVLCLSTDEAFVSRVSAPLEVSYPQVSVLTVSDPAAGVEVIAEEDVDCVVADYATAAEAPALFEAIRERHPDPTLLLLSRFGDDGAAIAEVVEFIDGVGRPDADDALATWVANSVVGGRPPGVDGRRDGAQALVRDVKQGLVDARSPGDVESAVAERLAFGDRYAFAWIGEYDRGEGQIVPWATAAREGEWPRARPVAVGDDSDGVIAEVVHSRSRRVVQAGSDREFPWGEAAVDRDCTAAAFFPLISGDELFGVMGVYADAPGGFADVDLEALSEVAESTAYVLEGMAIRGRIDQQERTLRRYERLVETVGDGMYALDADGHFMTVNDALCAMTGYQREGVLGEHVGLVLDDADARRWEETVERLRSAGGRATASLELEIRRKDGETVPCENKVALLPSDDGEAAGTVGVLRDVTERVERERALERQNERLDAFASIVSHDLRNPLSVAQGYLDLLAESTDDAAVEDVRVSLNRMEEIIEDVLALAREGGTVTDPRRVDLRSVARRAWETVDTREATLSVADSTVLLADESRLRRALENLFRNAVEHGGADVTVRVGATAEGFYVEDDGPGMDREVRDRVFESSFTTAEEGLGIGLWVVREVADAHDWSATATVGTDGGARFEFGGVATPSE